MIVDDSVAIAGRRQNHFFRIEYAGFEQADFSPKFVTVHIEIDPRQSNPLDFAFFDVKIVSDVVNGEEKGDFAEGFRVGRFGDGSD